MFFFGGGGEGGGRALIRGNTAIGLYMITTWQLELEKNVNGYGGMQEPLNSGVTYG